MDVMDEGKFAISMFEMSFGRTNPLLYKIAGRHFYDMPEILYNHCGTIISMSLKYKAYISNDMDVQLLITVK